MSDDPFRVPVAPRAEEIEAGRVVLCALEQDDIDTASREAGDSILDTSCLDTSCVLKLDAQHSRAGDGLVCLACQTFTRAQSRAMSRAAPVILRGVASLGTRSRSATKPSLGSCTMSGPGNVRELRNVVDFAVTLTDGPAVGVAEVSAALDIRSSVAPPDDRAWMRHHVVSVLADCNGDIARVSVRLGLHPSNVYRLLRRLGVDPPKRRRLPPESYVGAASAADASG